MKQERNSFRRKLKVFRLLFLVFLLITVVGIALVMIGKMEDSVEGRGTIYGYREYELKSSVQSRIAKIYFENGQKVKAGDILLELDDRELQAQKSSLTYKIEELKAMIRAEEWSFKVLEHDPLPERYRHTEVTLAEYRERVIRSKNELDIFLDLSKKGAVSKFELNQKQLAALTDASQLEKLEIDYNKLKSGLANDILDEAKAKLELLHKKLQTLENELMLAEKRDVDYKVFAPENGTISYIPTKRGTYVVPGQILANVAADGARKCIAWIDEKDIYKVSEGQKVRFESSQYNYFEHGFFEGEIYAIEELPEAVGNKNYYRVRILMSERDLTLRLGSSGSVEILVGRDYIFKVITGMR